MSRKLVPVALLALLLAVALLESLALTGPSISPGAPFTNNTLNCTWSVSGDTLAQNITVRNGSAVYSDTYENASLMALNTSLLVPAADTRKGEEWTCVITLHNATASIAQNASVTIRNSPPTTEGSGAGVFNASGLDVGFLVQATEDATFTLDVNATDSDEDTLTYLNADEFCVRVSSALGTYLCSPTQADLSGNAPTPVNITFTASDGQNVGGRTITINVTPVNDAPQAALSNQTTPVNTSLNMTFSASDEESGFPLHYALVFNSSNAEIQGTLSLTRLNTDGTSISVFYNGLSPDFNDVGVWPVYINITDTSTNSSGGNDSRSAVHAFWLNLSASGRRPFVTNVTPAGPYLISQGQAIQINLSANDPDANSTLAFADNTSRFTIVTTKADTNASDAQAQINFTPGNADVGAYSVTVTVQDQEGLTNTTTLNFTVANVNDPPTVHELSASGANTQGNTNLSNLTAYANAPFVYDVNASDPDSIHGDTLAFADNTSLFAIDPLTGRISFTPSAGQVQPQPYQINITATDNASAQESRVAYLTIRANTPPRFNATLPTLSCGTKTQCALDLSAYATDDDAGDSVALYAVSFVGTSLGSFSHNQTSGIVNFTTLKTDVGNYAANVTIRDTFGATNSTLLQVQVTNTPEAPDLTRFNFSDQTIVETHELSYELRADDDDFLVASASEQVNFTTNLSVAHNITPLATQNTTARAQLSFTPSLGQAGNYTIEINATDRFGLVSREVITFQVFPKVPPPNITDIAPWGSGANASLNASFASASIYPSRNTTVNTTENRTLTFALVVEDTRPLTYVWSINGTQNATTQNLTLPLGFFSAGRYAVSVNVSNDRLEHATWSWDLHVQDVNRPPVLVNNLTTPLSVNTTFLSQGYFTGGTSTTRFYDPDDDRDSDAQIDGGESVSLVFSTVSSCSAASFTIAGGDLTVTPVAIGTCNVVFTARDAQGLTADSNTVFVNVSSVPEGGESQVSVTTSGGGGTSSTRNNYIPITRDHETPQAFSLVAPRLVTVYRNRSVIIPVTINNTWSTPLEVVRIWAEANATGVTTSFDQDFFESIPVNESREVLLTVENYRHGENYEVLVRANVSDPEYEDEAAILLNSIERAEEGDDVDVKVTFANDLLNEHPECQELNEVLEEAKRELADDDVEQAKRLVDSVISGCRYLVSLQQGIEERPSRANPIIALESLSLRTLMWSVLAFVMLVSVALISYYHYSYKQEEDI